jgi:UDPglucose--hexose-1-phosphate uridylyltransferase
VTDGARERATTEARPSPLVRTRAGRLSDGREIIYFDESEQGPAPADPRRLPPHAASPAIRFDPILCEWVAMASHRQDRTHLPPDDQCPLCPSTAERHGEIPASDYDVVVFENRFPSFASHAGAADADSTSNGVLEQRPASGRCEVVCFTSDHNLSFSHLPAARVRTILSAWIDRTVELSALPHVEQIFCFENRGEEIGVTLSHPHGQIYAYPFVTPKTRRMLESARNYRDQTARNLFTDTLAAEVESGERIVLQGEHWTAFVPFAARWPLEVHLYPHRSVASLPDLSPDEQAEFADLYPELLRRMERAFGTSLPYISAWHQAPVRGDDSLWHLHLQISSIRRAPGKLKYLAGSESAMGAFVNDVVPEEAAQAVRDARG